MILPYQHIRSRCQIDGLITPWSERTKEHGMTYGLGPAGYDVRIADSLMLFPGAFRLASTIERFNMPYDLIAQVCDKSTWARKGICVQNTIIEPGWHGYLTIELTNHSESAIEIKEGAPICQIIFFELAFPTYLPYQGKYQDQPNHAVEAIEED